MRTELRTLGPFCRQHSESLTNVVVGALESMFSIFCVDGRAKAAANLSLDLGLPKVVVPLHQ